MQKIDLRNIKNEVLKKIYETKYVEDLYGNHIDAFPTSISLNDGLVLYYIVKKTNSENTLEIGFAYGLSALFILQAHKDKGGGFHTAIDPIETDRWRNIGLLNVKRANLENLFKFYELPSYKALPVLLNEIDENGKKYDFIFIDGNHTFDYVLLDFFYADKLLKLNGYIMLDDNWMPSVRKAVSFIIKNRNYELSSDIFGNYSFSKRFLRKIIYKLQSPLEEDYSKGFPYCILKKTSEDNREWNYYKNF